MPLRFKSEAEYHQHLIRARQWPTVGASLPTPFQRRLHRLWGALALFTASAVAAWMLT